MFVLVFHLKLASVNDSLEKPTWGKRQETNRVRTVYCQLHVLELLKWMDSGHEI